MKRFILGLCLLSLSTVASAAVRNRIYIETPELTANTTTAAGRAKVIEFLSAENRIYAASKITDFQNSSQTQISLESIKRDTLQRLSKTRLLKENKDLVEAFLRIAEDLTLNLTITRSTEYKYILSLECSIGTYAPTAQTGVSSVGKLAGYGGNMIETSRDSDPFGRTSACLSYAVLARQSEINNAINKIELRLTIERQNVEN